MSGWKFNPPPGWPPAPAGFLPPSDWRPDPSWPPAPDGWMFWLPDYPVEAPSAAVTPAASLPTEESRREEAGRREIQSDAKCAEAETYRHIRKAKAKVGTPSFWADLKAVFRLSPSLAHPAARATAEASVADHRWPWSSQPPTQPQSATSQQHSPPQSGLSSSVRTPKWHQPPGQVSLFAPAYVTRSGTREPRARDMLYAAVDIETTGLDPRSDRVCEIAIVRFRGDGEIESEYASVINPQRVVAATKYHYLTDADVVDAPTFAEVAADVAHYLSGAVVVAHNLEFEDGFLAAEFRRARHPVVRWPGLCTMVTARAQMEGPAYSLMTVYRTMAGEWLEDHHLALADARAAAKVLCGMIEGSPSPLRYFGPQPCASARRLPASRIAARSGTRGPAEGLLAVMVSRLPRTGSTHPSNPGRADEYLNELAGLLQGGKLRHADAAKLEGKVRDAGLDQTGVLRLNALAWGRVLEAAGDPATLSQNRLQTLADAASCLGLADQAQRFQQDIGIPANPAGPLKGWRIGLIPGSPEAEKTVQFAMANGATLAKRLTKTVRILVADNPEGAGEQLALARRLGLRIVPPVQAEPELRAAVETALARQRAQLAEQEKWERESDAHWRHRWRPREVDPAWGRNGEGITVKLR